jgi:perosamine synthetase
MSLVRIPITKPLIGELEYERVKAVIEGGWLTQGEETFEFERVVAAFCGARYAVAMNSATTALHVALLLAGVGAGDEVILPSYSHVATANAVTYTGATPVFLDIKPDTYNIDETRIGDAISERTKAILVVHQVGLPVALAAVTAIAERHGLRVIEDAACALGSRYAGRRIGAHGNVAVLSFHPRKIITTGEGGMVLTDASELAEQARRLASHGVEVLDVDRHNALRPTTESFSQIGFNYRLTNIQGAIGIGQMSRVERILETRRALAKRYTSFLREIPGVEVPVEPEDCEANYQSYMVRITPDADTTRDELMLGLRRAGIATRPGITAIHRQPAYRAYAEQDTLEETERALDETLILPLYPQLGEDEQDEVIQGILNLTAGRPCLAS